MNDARIDAQYSTGLSRRNIEQALITAGKDLGHLQPADLGPLEDFHTLGRIATSQLAELAKITSEDAVLDAGSGIGGTARFLADQYRCRVTAIDLTEEYCETARWLNQLTRLDDRISVRQGDVTDLPFADASFDVVTSQHVQMNVADKTRLYREARRVLARGGRLAIWDITAGPPGELDYPLPWADNEQSSFVESREQYTKLLSSAGFVVERDEDRTAALASAGPPAPGSLTPGDLFGAGFAERVGNNLAATRAGILSPVLIVARAV